MGERTQKKPYHMEVIGLLIIREEVAEVVLRVSV